eukprot:662472-Amphidinium_carterae.2
MDFNKCHPPRGLSSNPIICAVPGDAMYQQAIAPMHANERTTKAIVLRVQIWRKSRRCPPSFLRASS